VEKLAFKDLYLTKVNLSHNEISKIEAGAFENCANITSLDLSYNKLDNISKYSFDSTSYAMDLQLSNNLLTSLNQVSIFSLFFFLFFIRYYDILSSLNVEFFSTLSINQIILWLRIGLFVIKRKRSFISYKNYLFNWSTKTIILRLVLFDRFRCTIWRAWRFWMSLTTRYIPSRDRLSPSYTSFIQSTSRITIYLRSTTPYSKPSSACDIWICRTILWRK
jgi:Leucine-rich repeat (LRR) protein